MEHAQSIDCSASARDAVLILVSDRFAQEFAEELGVELLSVEAQVVNGIWQHKMSCAFRTEHMDVPGIVRRVLPNRLRVDWASNWTIHSDTRATAELLIRSDTSPTAETKGDAALEADEGSLTYSFTGRTTVSVPLIGGTLADMIDEHLVAGILEAQMKVLGQHFT